jgi:hypothetical protein
MPVRELAVEIGLQRLRDRQRGMEIGAGDGNPRSRVGGIDDMGPDRIARKPF